MLERFLFAFLIRLDDEFAAGVAEFHRAAFAFHKMFRRDLLPVDERDRQPVGQSRAKFLHQIQRQRWPIGTIHMQEADKRIKPDARQRRHAIMPHQRVKK